MIDLKTVNKIYILSGFTDLRKSIDGLASLINKSFKQDPFDNSLYLFCNKNKTRIKILHYELNGFWIYYKRLEQGKFKWPKKYELKCLEIRQFHWLFEGLSIEQKTFKSVKYDVVY